MQPGRGPWGQLTRVRDSCHRPCVCSRVPDASLEPARMRHSLVEVLSRLRRSGNVSAGTPARDACAGRPPTRGKGSSQVGLEVSSSLPPWSRATPATLSPENTDPEGVQGPRCPLASHARPCAPPPPLPPLPVELCLPEKHRAVLPSVWGGGGGRVQCPEGPSEPPTLGLWSPPLAPVCGPIEAVTGSVQKGPGP